jgi:hypothetical protein
VTIHTIYVYDAFYLVPPPPRGWSFGLASGTRIPIDDPARAETSLWQEHRTTLVRPASWLAFEQGIGGWTLTVHHAYDPIDRVLYLGDGTRSEAAAAVNMVINRFAGNGSAGFSGDDGPALEAQLASPFKVAVAPDRTVFIADCANCRVRKITPDGTITTVAGGGSVPNPQPGDGGGALRPDRSGPRPGRELVHRGLHGSSRPKGQPGWNYHHCGGFGMRPMGGATPGVATAAQPRRHIS